MAQRLPNPRLAKVHHSYTVDEAAKLFGVHRNTVRQWIKRGLPTCDDRRPVLILGSDLSAFLKNKRRANKRPCEAGELYCVRCRAPKVPALGMADFVLLTPRTGNLIGICPTCEGVMYRRASAATWAAAAGMLEVVVKEGEAHIAESPKPSVNSDFKQGA